MFMRTQHGNESWFIGKFSILNSQFQVNDACPPVPVCPRSGAVLYPRTQIVVGALSGRHPTGFHWVRAGPNIPNACTDSVLSVSPPRCRGGRPYQYLIVVFYLIIAFYLPCQFVRQVYYSYILMAFTAFPKLMASYRNSLLETHKVKLSGYAYRHKQLAAIRAFYFLLSFRFCLLLRPVFAVGYGRVKLRYIAVGFDNKLGFILGHWYQLI